MQYFDEVKFSKYLMGDSSQSWHNIEPLLHFSYCSKKQTVNLIKLIN